MVTYEFWLILAIIAIIVEALTLTFFLLSIGLGAIAAGILSYYNYNLTIQIVVFAIVTIIFIILSRPLSKRLNKNSSEKKSNTDRLKGKTGIVLVDMDPNHSGLIRVYGEEWKAITSESLYVDDEVIIDGVSGVKLVVKKK